MESLLLHTKLLPGERDGLFPHACLLLHSGARDLPRSSAALRSGPRPVGNDPADPRHGAGLSRYPKSDGGGCGGAQEECEARGQSADTGEGDVEAVAAAVPLHPRPALSVEGKQRAGRRAGGVPSGLQHLRNVQILLKKAERCGFESASTGLTLEDHSS